MKQVKCVITDDEPTACEGLQRYVEKVMSAYDTYQKLYEMP